MAWEPAWTGAGGGRQMSDCKGAPRPCEQPGQRRPALSEALPLEAESTARLTVDSACEQGQAPVIALHHYTIASFNYPRDQTQAPYRYFHTGCLYLGESMRHEAEKAKYVLENDGVPS